MIYSPRPEKEAGSTAANGDRATSPLFRLFPGTKAINGRQNYHSCASDTPNVRTLLMSVISGSFEKLTLTCLRLVEPFDS